MKELEAAMQAGRTSSDENPVILSTIHSSKGLEYDTVYMVDVYDGRFPTSRTNSTFGSKDDLTEEQEERRLFYVGITRAKNRLVLMNIQNKKSQYLSELFSPDEPPPTSCRVRNLPSKSDQTLFIPTEIHFPCDNLDPIYVENALMKRCESKGKPQQKPEQEDTSQEMELRRQEVQDKFTQQTERIFDHAGQRWIKCKLCGKIGPDTEFTIFGGVNQENAGVCTECARTLE